MKKIFAREGLTLAPGEVTTRLITQAGTVQVLRGLLWITVIGSPEDHWVPAGAALVLAAGDRVVIEAFDREAVLMLMPLAGNFNAVANAAGVAHARRANDVDVTKWNLSLPNVTQSTGIFIQGKRASNVTGKFFRQWCARQPRCDAT